MLPLICLESQLLTFSVPVRGHPNRTAPTKAMIVVCPTCATRQDLPQSNLDLNGSLIRCTRMRAQLDREPGVERGGRARLS